MANRFPLVVDTTAGNQFRELPDGDNLLLTNSSIVNALDITALGTVTASQLVVDGTVFRNDYTDLQNKPVIPTSILQLGIGDGATGQFLTTNGTGTISFQNLPVQTPTLGGALSGTTAAALINANTIGISQLDVDDGTIGQVLATDGSGNLQFLTISGGGGGGATVQRFKLSYASNGNLSGTSDKTSLVDSISIDSATGGDCTVTFDSSINYPPASIMVYGYDYTNNKYYAVPLETTMGLREIAGNGSSGSPTVFNGSSTIALKLRLRETETGASRGGFGTTTHAWIEFVVYD